MKDYSGAKHSNAHVTPDCESVNPKEKQFDFSAFNNYLTDVIHPEKLASGLEEFYQDYLTMALVIAMQSDYPVDYDLSERKIDRFNYLYNIKQFINLLKNL